MRGSMAGRPIVLRAATTLVALVLVCACSDQGVAVVRVHNGLDEPIHIWAEPRGRPVFEVSVGRDIQPGDGDVIRYDIFPGSTCMDGVLIARSRDGRELARSAGQVCPGDSWEVDAEG